MVASFQALGKCAVRAAAVELVVTVSLCISTVGVAYADFGEQLRGIQIDTQEWREKPVRHLYIHGVWNGDTAFQIVMPAPEKWKDRLMQWLQGGLGGSERDGERMGHHLYALSHGAVYVESTQGHIGPSFYEEDDTPPELAYEASLAVAEYARGQCLKLYGKRPSHCYIFGGSGGGVRASGILERFPREYDGAVCVVGVGDVPFVVYLHSLFEANRPLVQPRARDLAEETRVPGQGDPFAVITDPKDRHALETILKAGFPRNALGELRPLFVGVTMLDYLRYKFPRYFEDFWKEPGYAGADGECRAALVENLTGTIRSVNVDKGVIVIDEAQAQHELFGFTIQFTSGNLKGQWRRVLTNVGPTLILGRVGPGITGARPGDTFRLNNRDLVAWRYLHKYLADDPHEPTMQMWFSGGRPRYGRLSGEASFKDAGRSEGRFEGKMIALFGTDDPLMWPTVAVRYHRLVREALGAKSVERFRLYFLEHGVHGSPSPRLTHRQVGNRAAIYKAMDDLVAWVEQNAAPPPSTVYSLDSLNQLVLPETASARKGYQPVVAIRVKGNGAGRQFYVRAEDPDNEVLKIEVDFEGDGAFDASREVKGSPVEMEFSHHYSRPGVYFPTARVTDSTQSLGARVSGIQNVAWTRVVIP